MNNIDKVKLIQELHDLIARLEHGSLSLFETVQTKKRIQDICIRFDEPIFQKYLPQNFVENEIKILSSDFTQRGSTTVQNQIKNPPKSAVKTVPSPLVSNVSEQSKTLELDDSLTITQPITKHTHEKSEDSFPELTTETKALTEILASNHSLTQLNQISIDGVDFPVTPVTLNNIQPSIYHLPVQTNSSSIILVNIADIENLIHRPIFMAEETTNIGSFTQYIIYMGAENEIEAIRLLTDYCSNSARKLSAIRTLKWQDLKDALAQNEALFKAYVSSTSIIFQEDNYFPFIPKSMVTNRKFILFDEAEAQIETPVIFLEERGKIRLICGKKRLLLDEHEISYPYVTLTRQQGLNWQIIQETIASLTQPVITLDLLNALNARIENK